MPVADPEHAVGRDLGVAKIDPPAVFQSGLHLRANTPVGFHTDDRRVSSEITDDDSAALVG